MRVRLKTIGVAVAAVGIFFGAISGSGAWAAQQAAIVMDMRNGAVLYEDGADRRQHPASLTKMMTLYLTFEAVRDGRLGLDQKLRVSKHASRQPASKLYLKAGQRVPVRDLIRATAIKSSNDAAMVLAEGIAGSQRAFGELMTRRARALGMTNSTFLNPHGLTQSGHLSTARDMAILARHLHFDFPQYWNIFGRTSDYAAGKRIWTTNRLLKSYRGADGLKTGYTRAAGYNLAATAHRGDERVVAILLGGRSSAQRNREVARLLDVGFSRAPGSVRTVKPQGPGQLLVAEAPLPEAKPGLPSTGFAALAEALSPAAEAAIPAAAPATVAGPATVRVAVPVSVPASVAVSVPGTIPAASAPAVAASAMSRSPLAPRSAALPARRISPAIATLELIRGKEGIPVPMPRPGSVNTDWAAQVGPYTSETAALASLADIAASRLAGEAVAAFRVTQVGAGGAPAYSLHLAGLTEGGAAQLCGVLSASNMPCDVVTSRR
jgi:D-alanyl-D-alanine carboxypeptidase